VTGRQWDAASVLAAANEWVWVPRDSRHRRTEEYLAVVPPAYMGLPVLVRVFGSTQGAAHLVDEVVGVARAWGEHRLSWRVSDATGPDATGPDATRPDATGPDGLEAELVRRGGVVEETLDVLALPLAGDLPDFAVPSDVTVRAVADEATMRDALLVSVDAFPGEQLTEERVTADLEELRTGLHDGPVGRVVSYVDGRPAATGGWTLVESVVRLWGGAAHTERRGRGAYRAVLAERLRLARGAGATLALSMGRRETSSPILQGLGFAVYGEQREVLLDVSGG
jgi:hypothetical protein